MNEWVDGWMDYDFNNRRRKSHSSCWLKIFVTLVRHCIHVIQMFCVYWIPLSIAHRSHLDYLFWTITIPNTAETKSPQLNITTKNSSNDIKHPDTIQCDIPSAF